DFELLLSGKVPGTPARMGGYLFESKCSLGTTRKGICRIRRFGCAATGPLARIRPTEPKQASSGKLPATLTEAEAIRLAQAGDGAAFDSLSQLHRRRHYALCLRMMGSPADGEALLQAVFLQLFRKIGDFRGESAFSTWLQRMTVNVVLMRLRKKSLP